MEWLQKDLAISGALKAAKVQGRTTDQGLISQSILSGTKGTIRGAMVELNCETDFVGRNELFGKLATDIAHTAAFISEPVQSDKLFSPCPLDLLLNAPLMSQEGPHPSATVESSIRDLITKVGENISLRRAVAVVRDPIVEPQRPSAFRLASYVHGTLDNNNGPQGRIGVLAMLALRSVRLDALLQSKDFIVDLELLERSIGRQIVGFDTQFIQAPEGKTDEAALYDQPFMMYTWGHGKSVREVLAEWTARRGLHKDGLEVMEFEKWTVGEPLESASSVEEPALSTS